jgi:hypothetical protein
MHENDSILLDHQVTARTRVSDFNDLYPKICQSPVLFLDSQDDSIRSLAKTLIFRMKFENDYRLQIEPFLQKSRSLKGRLLEMKYNNRQANCKILHDSSKENSLETMDLLVHMIKNIEIKMMEKFEMLETNYTKAFTNINNRLTYIENLVISIPTGYLSAQESHAANFDKNTLQFGVGGGEKGYPYSVGFDNGNKCLLYPSGKIWFNK